MVENWGPVGAFLGWTVRPEFWDDQPFILVDYLPLRRRSWPTRPIAAQGDRRQGDDPGRREARSRRLAESTELTAAALTAYLRVEAAEADRKTIAELAVKLSEEHKWLTPRELEEAKISHKGQTHCRSWIGRRSLDEQKQQFDANPRSAERLTESSAGRSRSAGG